jgi:hypothetical protein
VAALYLETIAECGVPDTGEMLRAHTSRSGKRCASICG